MLEVTPTIPASPPRQRRTRRIVALAVVAVPVLVVLHWLLFQGYEYVPGVIARPLGPCDVSWFENKGGVLVLGCPHTDAIKLWPLPLEQPWWEDLPAGPNEKVG
jgi:hypothetical protein